jgi:mRNA interferase MazF
VKTKRAYVPGRGDVVWITLDPQAGHEQRGRRPALILSPAAYNAKVGLALLCPITNQVKGYPFEVALPDALPVTGVVLSDQVKSLDWQARDCTRVCAIPNAVVGQVLRRLNTLLGERAEPKDAGEKG